MIENFLNNEYIKALLILVAFVIIAKILLLISKRYVSKLTAKTKTDIDNLIFEKSTGPVYSLIIIAGIYIALKSLSIVATYDTLVKGVFFILVSCIIALLVSRNLGILISHVLRVNKKFEKTPQLISKTVSVIIYLIALIVILDYLGVAISPILATLGVGGLAVGLALQPTLADLFAGIHIISDRPIHVGDFVELDAETKGTVEDIGWRSTRIKTPSNNIIVVPNAKLAESTIVNISYPQKETSCVVHCGVGYNEDLEKVEDIIFAIAKKVLKNTKGAVKTYKPLVRFYEFGDSNINFKVIMRAQSRGDTFLLKHEFIKALKKEFDKKKIEISFPVRKLIE